MINQGDVVIIKDDLSTSDRHPCVCEEMLDFNGAIFKVKEVYARYGTQLFIVSDNNASSFMWADWMCSHRTNGSNKLIKIRS